MITQSLGVLNRVAFRTGEFVWYLLLSVQSFGFFIKHSIQEIPFTIRHPGAILEQMRIIGIASLPLVLTTSVFTGGVVAIQAVTQFGDYLPMRYVGTVVGKSVMVELGPVLTGLVVAGRVSAAMAAEIGTMSVTEQLDAMKCLGLNVFRFLMAPRILASAIMLPILTIYASTVAILGALLVVYVLHDLPPSIFWAGVRQFYSHLDLVVGLVKSFLFGVVIAVYGCYFGYTSKNGSEGVGRSTRSAVVGSGISMLVLGYLVSYFIL
jgi:phospholipid/cholesterol/gamma-HCH transport system permease protein